MVNTDIDQGLSDTEKNGYKKDKSKKSGCLIGCLGIILLIIGFMIFNMYVSTPQSFGDRDKVIEDIYRYHKRYGKWPQTLEELKSKLPDYQFNHRYGFTRNDEMFIVEYQGGGLMGDDSGEYYRSDTREWKDIYSNRKELNDLVFKLRSSK